MTSREDGFSVLGHITSGNLGIIHRRLVLRTKTQYFYQYFSSVFMDLIIFFTIFYTFGNLFIILPNNDFLYYKFVI